MKRVLLLIDLQGDFLSRQNLLPRSEQVIAAATVLLQGCRAGGIPVIHGWTTLSPHDDRRLPHWKQAARWLCVAGTPGQQPPPGLAPLPAEPIVHKTGFNVFADHRLAELLTSLEVETVLLAGVHLHACVRTAAAECLQRGYRVLVAEDAVASDDPIHAAATRRWLAARTVLFQPVQSLLAGLDGAVTPNGSKNLAGDSGPAATSVAAAAEAARRAGAAARRGEWPLRRQFLERVALRLEREADGWAEQMAVDIGKPVRHGREEVLRTCENLRDVVRRADAFHGGCDPQVRRRPLGVIAVITPWNNPVAIPLGKIAPALAYGNVVLWKPSPWADRLALRLHELLLAQQVPAAAVHLLPCDDAAGRQLLTRAELDGVSFTGSIATGYSVMEACAGRLLPVQAELGGNGAIVWDDADLAHAAQEIAWGAFAFAGQRCTANRRAVVSRDSHQPFLQALARATARLPLGDPLDVRTEIGPMLHASRRQAVAEVIERAVASGAVQQVIRPHEPQSRERMGREGGAFLSPAIVCCDQPASEIVQEETMGPVLVVQPAEDFNHALALCNGVRQGLAAALFSSSAERQARFLDEAEAGVLKLNRSTAGIDVTLPFGGWKASGLGHAEHGEADLLFFTRLQAVYRA